MALWRDLPRDQVVSLAQALLHELHGPVAPRRGGRLLEDEVLEAVVALALHVHVVDEEVRDGCALDGRRVVEKDAVAHRPGHDGERGGEHQRGGGPKAAATVPQEKEGRAHGHEREPHRTREAAQAEDEAGEGGDTHRGRPALVLGQDAREEDEREGQQRRVQRLGHGGVAELDGGEEQRVRDPRPPPPRRSRRPRPEVPHRHRDQRIERRLDDLDEHQARAGDGEQPGQEQVIQRRDGPRPAQRPLAPLVAGEDVPEGPRVLHDAERALPVVVLVREQQRLVGDEAPGQPGQEREQAERRPPRDPADHMRSTISRVQRIER